MGKFSFDPQLAIGLDGIIIDIILSVICIIFGDVSLEDLEMVWT